MFLGEDKMLIFDSLICLVKEGKNLTLVKLSSLYCSLAISQDVPMVSTLQPRMVHDRKIQVVSSTGQNLFNIYFVHMQLKQPSTKKYTTSSTFSVQ